MKKTTTIRTAGAGLRTGKNRKEHPAQSAELLPAPEEKRMNPKWFKHYRRLVELRARLLQDKADLAKDALEPIPADGMGVADSGTEEFDRDMAIIELAAKQDLISEIEQALHRIKNNAYGICELTQKPIPETRLNTIPWTRFRKEAEEELERQGATRRAHLGQVVSVKSK